MKVHIGIGSQTGATVWYYTFHSSSFRVRYVITPSSSSKQSLPQRRSYPRVLQPLQHLQQLLRRLLRLVIPFHVRQRELDADRLAVGRSPVILHVPTGEKDPDKEDGGDTEVEPDWEGGGWDEGEDRGCEERGEDLLWIQSSGTCVRQ